MRTHIHTYKSVSQENLDCYRKSQSLPAARWMSLSQMGWGRRRSWGNPCSGSGGTPWLRVQGEIRSLEKGEGSLFTKLFPSQHGRSWACCVPSLCCALFVWKPRALGKHWPWGTAKQAHSGTAAHGLFSLLLSPLPSPCCWSWRCGVGGKRAKAASWRVQTGLWTQSSGLTLSARLHSPKLAFSWSLYHPLLCFVDHFVVTLTDLMFSFFRSLSISPHLPSFSFFNCAEIHTM